MKFTFFLLCFFSFSTFAQSFKTPIHCTGEGRIQGMLWTKRVNLDLQFNSFLHPYGLAGHKAFIDGKAYAHAGDVSHCKKLSRDIIECEGNGLGNGPQLKAKIDIGRGEASGTYFNPDAKGYEFSNESNTYVFEHLSCTMN